MADDGASSGDEDLLPFERAVKRDAYKRALDFEGQLEV